MSGEDNIGKKIRERLENHESPVPDKLWVALQLAIPAAASSPTSPSGSEGAPAAQPVAQPVPAPVAAPLPPVPLFSPFIKLIYAVSTAGMLAVTSTVTVKNYSSVNQSSATIEISRQSPSSPVAEDSTLVSGTTKTLPADSAAYHFRESIAKHPTLSETPFEGIDGSGKETEESSLAKNFPNPSKANSARIEKKQWANALEKQQNLSHHLPADHRVLTHPKATASKVKSQEVAPPASTPKDALRPKSTTEKLPVKQTDIVTQTGILYSAKEGKNSNSTDKKTAQPPVLADPAAHTPVSESQEKVSRKDSTAHRTIGSFSEGENTISLTSGDSLNTHLRVDPQPDSLAYSPSDSAATKQTEIQVAIEPIKPQKSRNESRFVLDGVFTLGTWAGPTGKADSSTKTSNVRNGTSMGVGLQGSYQITPRLWVGAGALAEKWQLHNQYVLRQTGSELYYEYQYGWRPSPVGGRDSVYTIIDSVANYRNKSLQVTIREKLTYSYLAIPLIISYHWHKNRFDYYAKGGIQVNILLSSKWKIAAADSSGTVFESHVIPQPNRLVAVATGSLGISYRLWRSLSVLVEPRFQYTLSPVYQRSNYPPQRLHSFGVITGLRLSF